MAVTPNLHLLSLENEVTHEPNPQEVLNQHRSILEAVKARDSALTRQRLTEHFDSIRVRTQKSVEASHAKNKSAPVQKPMENVLGGGSGAA